MARSVSETGDDGAPRNLFRSARDNLAVLTSRSLSRDSLWGRNERVVDRDKPHEWRHVYLSLRSVVADQETSKALRPLELVQLLAMFQINRDLCLS
jgi:hypothetical protein